MCWAVFFSVDHSGPHGHPRLALSRRLDSNVSETTLISSSSSTSSTSSNTLAVAYLLVMLCVFALTFAFLLVAEIKEARFRSLEKRVARQNAEGNKFDTKTAERDLKAAMEAVISQEKDARALKTKLDQEYASVDKLRDLYAKIGYSVALLVLLFLFVLCFVLFAYPAASLGPITHFVWFCEATLLLYVVYPFQAGVCLLVGVALSVLFEVLTVREQLAEETNIGMSTIFFFV